MRKIERLIYTNERGESVEFSHKSIFHTNDVSGLADIRNQLYSISSMGQDGDTFLGNRIQVRDIEIVGSIAERRKDQAIALRRKLNHILNPHLKATLIYEYGDFRRAIDCGVDNTPVFSRKSIFLNFTVQLTCHNPFWRDEHETREDIAAWVGAFEFPLEIPIDTGIEMGYREPALIKNIFNGGDVACGARFDFRAIGTVVTPSILDINTRQFIKVNTTLQAGDILSVSTYYGNKTVLLKRGSQTTNVFRLLDPDSSYIQLNIGDNLFRYDAESGLESLEVSVYLMNQYTGV